jgi:hypothetical protein
MTQVEMFEKFSRKMESFFGSKAFMMFGSKRATMMRVAHKENV